MEKEQSLLLAGYLGATIGDDDRYTLEVLSSVLSGINGRLQRRIREELGFAYALDVVSRPGIERGMIIFYIGTTNENLQRAEDELFKQIEILKTDGISDEELASAKSQLIGLHKIGLQKIQDVSMTAALGELYGLGWNNFLRYEKKITDVTKENVLNAAKKYLDSDSYVLLLVKGAK